MTPTKLTWEKFDTFDTIREKLLKLKGKSVVNTQDEKLSFTIFNISEIKESYLPTLGKGFFKFLEGDASYATRGGDYNWKDDGNIDTWCFTVEYGYGDKDGNTCTIPYNFHLTRKESYEKDLKESPIVMYNKHPFIFYNLK